MRPGTRVRAGDRLAYVDVLGVRQEVVSPVDGIVGATLAEAGDAVEYGQELVRLELAGQPGTQGASGGAAATPGPAASAPADAAPGSAASADAADASAPGGPAADGGSESTRPGGDA